MKLKPFLIVGAVCLFSMTILSLKPKGVVYTYIDSNNNNYIITPENINYEPISKVESSSGEYDGGAPKTANISTEQFAKIEGIIHTILADKSSHEKNREMGFGTIVIGKEAVYINRNSSLKTELENELKLCLQ